MMIAKLLVAFVAVYGYGGVIFDVIIPATARQHLWNPNWPPHAKLHNSQTMLFGIANGTLTLIVLFGFQPLSVRLFLLATALAATYWVTMLVAPIFPGTVWCDPEFREETPRPFGLHPQQLISWVLLGLLAVAVALMLALR